MQKLGSENINTPLDTSLVQCNCDLQLNKDQTLYPELEPSVASKKTSTNNLEVNLRQHSGGSDLRVLNVVYAFNEASKKLGALLFFYK